MGKRCLKVLRCQPSVLSLAEGRFCFCLLYQALYLSFCEEGQRACCLCNPVTFAGVGQPANLLFLLALLLFQQEFDANILDFTKLLWIHSLQLFQS